MPASTPTVLTMPMPEQIEAQEGTGIIDYYMAEENFVSGTEEVLLLRMFLSW